jgi:peptidoglycan/LPS O-acetylase OafA/YrhL
MGVVRALTFTCNFPGADCGSYLGAHTWSLSVEEQFYLVIPVLFLIMNAHRRIATCLLMGLPVAGFLGTAGTAMFVANFLPISIGVACALNEGWLRAKCTDAPGLLVYGVMVALAVAVRLTYTRFWRLQT